MVFADRVDEVGGERPLPAGERPRGGRMGGGERLDLGPGRGPIADRGPAEELLGGDPGQVDARVGVDQAQAPRRTVRDELGVGGDRLGELPVLEGEVAEQLEGIIPPGAAERLVDDPAEQGPIPGVTPLAKPAFGLRVDPGPVEGPGFGRQGGDPPLALAPGVDREPRVVLAGRVRVRRDVDDLVAELLDHALVDLDRLGMIAGPGVVVGAPEVGVGLVARVEVDLGARPGDLPSELELARGRAGRDGPGDQDGHEDGKPARDRPRPAHPAAADISHD